MHSRTFGHLVRSVSLVRASLCLAAVALAGPGRLLANEAEVLAKSHGTIGADLPVEIALLTDAPEVPPHIGRLHPAKVLVNLEVTEAVQRLADGVEYTFWTFGGKVPGKFIRVREGDVVEFHLHNHPGSKLPHNIDLHAVTGPGGGAASTFTAPGHSSQFTFTALRPGLYVYHCATAPVPMHVANGMYGMIFVQPKEGWAPADREYYVMQGDIYTQGKNGEPGLQMFDNEKAIDEKPTYIVFNGSVGSMVGDKALTANVGETVRIYFGVGGPNLTSSFHVIGEIFDRVYLEGGTSQFQENVQTTMVPAGGSTIVEFHTDVPGNYVLVDHSLTRAFNKGAIGMLKVNGPELQAVYSGKQADATYEGDGARAAAATVLAAAPVVDTTPVSHETQMERGKALFNNSCFACHGATGEGLPGVFPPLANSDFLKANPKRAIDIVTKGLSGAVQVNGKKYENLMPPLPFDDAQVADVLTYVFNTWGNNFGDVSTSEVKEARASKTAGGGGVPSNAPSAP